MFELLVVLTGLTLASGMLLAYQRTRDVLHPMLFLGPLFLHSTAVEPWLMKDQLDRFFRYQEDIEVVLYLYLFCVAALVLGVLHRPNATRGLWRALSPISSREAGTLHQIAVLLAVGALAAYTYGILNVGGFVAAFSRVKGGGETSSGYIGEAMNLGLAATAIVAVSRYRRGWTNGSLTLLFLGLLPNLVQGTFGGRRGPLFLAMAGLVVAWIIARRKRPPLLAVGCALAAVLLSIAFVSSQRSNLYLGSDESFDWGALERTLSQEEMGQASNFVYGAGLVTATRHSGHFTWGRELAVNLFVRPVPRQWWPTKYEDVDAYWVTNEYPGLGHLTIDDWLDAVGWIPLAGSSAVSISDLFGEFGWGAVLAMYLVGRGFAFLRARRLSHGGVWALLHFEAIILTIYLATQSFSAFYHRFLILAVPTVIVWNLFVRPRPQTRAMPLHVGTISGGRTARLAG